MFNKMSITKLKKQGLKFGIFDLMKKNLFLKFEKVLSSSKKIIIIPHKNPDGDALGSAISLNLFLNKTGHQSQIISPNDYPDFLNGCLQKKKF